jgi:UDP-N-acetyl-D-mannosaminuronic acid dehydrogenase
LTALESLRRRIADRKAKVAVVGLGYVGLPVATLIAASGFEVVGVDLRRERVDPVSAGQNPLPGTEPELPELLAEVVAAGRLTATTNSAALSKAEVILVAVETPVDDDHHPGFQALRAACKQIGSTMADGTLVIVESTIAPGTMETVVIPELEKASGKRCGDGFHAGHCPERVMPGRLLLNLRTMSRVVGGHSPAAAGVMAELYRSYVQADLDLTDMQTAEIVKTTENSYRDVNIAFANELAMICDKVGADVWTVRRLVNKSPGRNVLLPGPGVGGHCLPKDPWLLVSVLGETAPASLIASARRTNEGMPAHTAALVAELLGGAGLATSGAVVAILGYSYLENSGDTRHSPSADLEKLLLALGCQVRLHDPFVPELRGDVGTLLAGSDCAVLMVGHEAYLEADWRPWVELMRHPLVLDARGVLDPVAAAAAGMTIRRLGAPPRRPGK